MGEKSSKKVMTTLVGHLLGVVEASPGEGKAMSVADLTLVGNLMVVGEAIPEEVKAMWAGY